MSSIKICVERSHLRSLAQSVCSDDDDDDAILQSVTVNGNVCLEGFSKVPHGVSCKTVFITGYMASYLLYTWFAAGVTSLLAVQGQDTHLQLSDVAQMGTDFSASWDGLLPDFFTVRAL
jgi:hypothetical protein